MRQRILIYLIVFVIIPSLIQAQEASREVAEQCGTMQRLQMQFERNPGLRSKFEQERLTFNNAVKRKAFRVTGDNGASNRTAFTIPVVFHIVLANPDLVTDATIQAQLNTLNSNYSGSNADSTRIPSYFKSLFGKSGIQFCLAQRTPTGAATTGIDKVRTTKTSFSNNDAVKHAAEAGANSWDTRTYLNIWICALSNNILGYSTLPSDGGAVADQGVVVDYRSLPGGSYNRYSLGKTLVHETGHYFNLYHTWGDDNGQCYGTDFVDDTPNQADASQSCVSGVKPDACTPGGNGIMYQNFMDYSFDSCMVMFTLEQVERMESAVIAYRSSLLNTSLCTPRNYDARLSSIDLPSSRLCGSPFTPTVTIKNQGSEVLTSLNISSKIDNGSITNFNWKGSLGYMASASVSLNNLTSPAGVHTLTIYVSSPNNNSDEDVRNDTISSTFQFYNPVASLSEGFEGNIFPVAGWDIGNPDNNITWRRVSGIAKTGSASVRMENFNYPKVGEQDDLRLPNVTLQNVDSAFLSFQVAATMYSNPASTVAIDTLQVLASSDCGRTYASVYKKFGNDLITRTISTSTNFVPTATEWRKDSIDLTNYIGQSNLLLMIRNINGYGNNIYLDDINLRTVVINPNLRRLGFLVTPNPSNGIITVQFYPQPNSLRAIQIFTLAGQKISEIIIGEGQAGNAYRMDISRYSAGMYIVRGVFTDSIATTKIFKY